MENEYEFSFDNVNEKNLFDLSLLQSNLCERRICELAEIADKATSVTLNMLADGMDIYEALAFISSGMSEFEKAIHSNFLNENELSLRQYLCGLADYDKVFFTELFSNYAKRYGRSFCENDFLLSCNIDETFVYVKNIYSDEAYDVFSQEFLDPRLRYANNFRDAVRLVNEGSVSYAILPLEEAGARIATISELIYRYDLKINSVIPVFGIDGEADIKYALVSKHFSVPVKQDGDDRYLEIRVCVNSDLHLGALMKALVSGFTE